MQQLEYKQSTRCKQYVKVRVDYHLDGRIVPLKFRTEDGPAVVIDQILDVRQAAALRAGGSEAQLSAVSDIFSYLDALSMKFYALSVSLDKNELSLAAAQEALLSEASTCRSLSTALTRTFNEDIPASARALCALLESIAASCETIQNSKSAARTGAALKSSQFSVIFGLRDLSASLLSP